MTPILRFQDLNPVGRSIIITVAALTAGIAAVAFLTSYGALYAFIRDAGLYSDRLTRIYPLLLDAAFIGAELAAILFRILRGSIFWSWVTMLLTGSLTVWFNVLHAPNNWGARAAAALPPVLMMLAFQIDVAIVRAVMRALGRTEQAFVPGGYAPMTPGPQMPSPTTLGMGRNGQPVGGGAGNTKAAILAVRDQLGTEEITAIGPEGVKEYLAEMHGVHTTTNYVRNVLSQNGNGVRS
jgi:Protein of unknown function (DUF2637)